MAWLNLRKGVPAISLFRCVWSTDRERPRAVMEKQEGWSIIFSQKTILNLVRQSRAEFLTTSQTVLRHVIFIHTHTGHCYGNIPASTCPLLLIMLPWQPSQNSLSFFLPLRPSLVFMTHNSQWKPQFSLSLIPLFPFTFFSVPKEQLAFLNHRCVFVACVCQGARAAGNSKQITNDGLLWRWQISGGVTCVL